MSKHFRYLIDGPANDFFFKIGEQAAGIAPLGPDIEQPFRKVAFATVILESDDVLKSLIDSVDPGFSGEATKIAMDYFDTVAREVVDLNEDEARALFDKCASTGIEADLGAMRAYLDANNASESDYAYLRKMSSSIVAEALMEKEASAAARVSGLIEGVGGGIKHMTTGLKSRLAGRTVKSVGKREAKLTRSLEKNRAAQKAVQSAAPVAGTGMIGSIRRAYRTGKARSLAAKEQNLVGKMEQGQEKMQQALKSQHAAQTEAAAVRGIKPPEPPKGLKDTTTKQTSNTAQGGQSSTQQTTAASAADDAAEAAEKGMAAGVGRIPKDLQSAWEKYKNKQPLTPDERASLAKAGLIGAVGYDAATD